MTDSNYEDAPSGTPEGTIPVDPDVGFAAHVADGFVEHYGEDSVFVAAAVDCLTHRFIRVLVRAGKLPEDHQAPQYGTPEMRGALDRLLSVLDSRGMDNPTAALMRSVVGRAGPGTFVQAAGVVVGEQLIGGWLLKMEQEDYVGADSLLLVH
jgi:hypothetical protein